MKKTLSLIALTLISLCVSSCDKESGKRINRDRPCCSQKIKINIGSEPGTFDPRKARTLHDFNMIRMFMEGITRLSKGGQTELGLAEKVDVSSDQLTYTIKLKPSKWSNGDPISAQDFIYSWKKALSPDFASNYAWCLYPIKNARSIKEGKLPLSFLGVEASDDHTLVIHLESPTPYFLELTSLPIYFPVNSKVDKIDPHWAERVETYTANGPFRPSHWSHHNKIVATKNEEYWGEKEVKLDEIEMVMVNDETGLLMFERGELDWQGSPHTNIPTDSIAALKKSEKMHSHPFLGTYWIRLNVEKGPLANANLRKALALAIDRQSVVDFVTQGAQIPTTGVVPASMGLHDEPYFKDHDVNGARALFQKALAELGVDHIPTITLTYASNERNHRIVQTLQDQWREALGISVALESLENKVYFSKVAQQDYMMITGSWMADFNDPISFLEVFSSKDNGTNNTNWEDPAYAALLQESYAAPTQEKRQELLKRCESLLIEAMPVIPIFTYSMLYMKDDRVQDVVLTDLGQLDFKWASVGECAR